MELEAAIGHGAKVSKKSDELGEEEKKGKLSGLLLFPFFLPHSHLMPLMEQMVRSCFITLNKRRQCNSTICKLTLKIQS